MELICKNNIMLRLVVLAVAINAGSVFSDCLTPPACPRRCKQTCATPNPKNCETNPKCSCQDGFVFRDKTNNTCISLYQCPQDGACDGDLNAIIQPTPLPVRSTCRKPKQTYTSERPAAGCVCKSGFILSKPGGKCIPPESCPGGNPCGRNETFSSCSINCPSGDCPTTDSLFTIACSIAYPCPGGCECKSGYRRNKQGKCILAQDCPPFTCTRPNEVYNRCPDPCGDDSCRKVLGQPQTIECVVVNPVCNPACVCKPLYARADNFTCIPAQDCQNAVA